MGALGSGSLQVLIDGIGLIGPEGGVVEAVVGRKVGNFLRYRGAVADQIGQPALGVIGAATGIGSTGLNLHNTTKLGKLSTLLGVAGLANSLGGLSGVANSLGGVPVLGQLISGAAVIVDGIEIWDEVANYP